MENIVLTIVRLVVPLTILRWPLLGGLLAVQIDISDWHFYSFNTPEDYQTYQVWDKLLDLYFWGLALYVALSWKDIIAKKLAIFSYFYRLVGTILLLLTGKQIFLFLFPNFLESLFFFYLVFRKLSKKEILFTSKKIGAIVLLALVIPKIVQEYVFHVGKIPLSTFIPQLAGNETISFWVLLALYLAIPLLVLFWRLKVARK